MREKWSEKMSKLPHASLDDGGRVADSGLGGAGSVLELPRMYLDLSQPCTGETKCNIALHNTNQHVSNRLLRRA